MAAAYAQQGQQGPKRPKVREPTRAVDSTEYFQERVEYNSEASPTDSFTYRQYNSTERIHGRTMEEWLRIAVSFTAFRSDGCDGVGKPTFNRSWDDHTSSIENYKRCIRAFFEFCGKLGLKYWTAFYSELVPWSDSVEEYKNNYEEMVEFLQESMQRTQLKLLWIAPDLHSHARYASGAATAYDANVFMQAACQVKKCLEIANRLNAECFLIWPIREGYDAIFKSDVPREMKLFAKLLKMTADFKERTQYKGQLLVMPYYDSRGGKRQMYWDGSCVPYENDVNRYMWDVTSCLYFLKHFNLDKNYKVCVPPGHHLFLANVYNMLGGVSIDSAYECDSQALSLMMKTIIEKGSVPAGGTSLALTVRRQSVEPRELVTAYVGHVDALARALRTASAIVSEQVFSKCVQQRYSSYYSGGGARVANADVTLDECEEHAKKCQHQGGDSVASRVAHWQLVFQRYCQLAEQRC